MNLIDNFLNQITMYRLVLYYLMCLLVVAVIFSLVGILPFTPVALIFSCLFIIFVCWLTNTLFRKVFKVPTNLESVYITALILALIITPVRSFEGSVFLLLVSVLAMSSKYILAINKKHIFNPAALAVLITAFAINRPASWWVGTSWMLPFVLAGGLLVLRKIKKYDLVFSFLFVSLAFILFTSFLKGENLLLLLQKILVDSPILFFAFVMLAEPLTSPPTKFLQSIYGGIVGFLLIPQIHLGSIYTTPELALIAGNIFSYLVSPKDRLTLKLKEKIQIGSDIFDFIFESNKKLNFVPGQYMEWTLGQKSPDSRGSRRYFTLASSPTEANLRIGVKFYPDSSSFKKQLLTMDINGQIIASQLSGEFTLQKDLNKKLVFIAGGIGVTPFRSIVKYLLDNNEKRNIILLFSNKTIDEIVYTDIFSQAAKVLPIKNIYTLTETNSIPKNWSGQVGPITAEMIIKEVPDYKERIFYISGPHAMVVAFEKILTVIGVQKSYIKIDYFPGYV